MSESIQDQPSSGADDERFWYCVKAQTRREHIAARHIRELDGVEVLCPQIRYRKATRRGKVWFQEALFPGYFFAKFDRGEHERNVKYAIGVRGLVRFGSQVPPVPDAFMDELVQRMEEQGGEVIELTPKIEVGTEVEVADGPLSGESGPVLKVLPGNDRVLVLIEMLGQKQIVSMDLFSLILPRPIDEDHSGDE